MPSRTRRPRALLLAALALLLAASAALGAQGAAAREISLTLDPPMIEADGTSTTVATATITDGGAPVTNTGVDFFTDGGHAMGTKTNHGDGTYSVTLTATTTVGTFTIYARDWVHPDQPTTTATLTQTRPCLTGATRRFDAIGQEQCYRVGAGVSRVRLLAVGGPGGGGARGALATRDLDVTPGQVLRVLVGGAGSGQSGGFNGGGTGGGRLGGDFWTPLGQGGGGASDVRTCSVLVCPSLTDEDTRLLVAAGGGGSPGANGSGGAAGEAGTTAGGPGAPQPGGPGGATSGGGGGGRGTEYFSGTTDGGHGTLGKGGDGGRGNGQMCGASAGGGGGGGRYGGGGGGGSSCGAGAGGGGGSSYAPGGTVARAASGTPMVVVSTQGAPAQLAIALSSSAIVANGSSTTTATATLRDGSGAPVVGEPVTIAASGGATVGAVADNGDGTYTATITSSRTAGPATVTAQVGPLMQATTLTQRAGPAATVALALDPETLVADGTSTTEATVTVADANGNPVAGDTIELISGDGRPVGAVTDHGDGTYTATSAATTVVDETIFSAIDRSVTPNVSDTAVLRQTPGPAAQLALELDPDAIVADGVETTLAVVTVTDAHGNGVPGAPVSIASDGGQTIDAITDLGDGTYDAAVTATTTAGQSTITATAGALSDTATLTQRAGAPAEIAVELEPPSIVADGADQTIATATVTDAHGNAIRGADVDFRSSGEQQIGDITDHEDGRYSAPVTATTTAGGATITALERTPAEPISDTAELTQVPGPAKLVELTLEPDELLADGAAETVATAVVTDAHGNRQPLGGDDVAFSASGDQAIGPVTDHGDGSYSATIAASERAGDYEVTATDRSIDPAASATAALTQRRGPAAQVAVALEPASIAADGRATTVATATVADAHGNPASGEPVVFSASGGQAVGPVTEHGDGVYSATVTATTTAGKATVTATVGGASGSAELTQTELPRPPGGGEQPPRDQPPGGGDQPPADPPADPLAVGELTVAADGAVAVRVAAPAAGRVELRVTARGGAGGRPVAFATAAAAASRAGTVRLVARPAARGRRLLRERGAGLRLDAAVSFAPAGGAGAGAGAPQTIRFGGLRLRSSATRPHARFAVVGIGEREGADGALVVRIRVPGAGRVTVRGTATAGGRRALVAAGSGRAKRAGVVRIVARPTARGRALVARGGEPALRLAVDHRSPGEPVRRLVVDAAPR